MKIKRFVITYGHSFVMVDGTISRLQESPLLPIDFAMESKAHQHLVENFEGGIRDLEDFEIVTMDF